MGNATALEAEITSARADPRRAFGRFLLLSELGRGGMGVVHRAWDESLGRVVATKMLLEDGLRDPEAVARFRREAEALAKLAHPGIVPVHETGVHGGRPYLVMDFVEGRTLARAIEAGLPLRDRVSVVAQSARALEHAHARGIVHRDLKPANIMIDPEGRALVMDFGLAKVLDARTRLSLTGDVLGTPSYMAPEQVAGGGAIDARTDVWGLGATLYHAIAGRPPFQGANALNVLAAIASRRPDPPSSGDAGALDGICLRCLEKDPARRYGSMRELAIDLDRWLASKPVARSPRSVPPVAIVGVVALACFVAGGLALRSSAKAGAPPAPATEKPASPSMPSDPEKVRQTAAFRHTSRTQLAAVLGTYGLKNAGEILGVAVSHDGKFAVSCSADGSVMKWNLESGEETATLWKGGPEIQAVAVSPDGREAVIGVRGGRVVVIDTATCVPRPFVTLDDTASAIAFSRGGNAVLLGSWRAEVKIFDLSTNGLLMKFDGPRGIVRHVAFSPDGEQVLACTELDHRPHVWSTGGGTERPGRTFETCPVTGWFLPDGARTAIADGATIVVGDMAESGPVTTWRRPGDAIVATALSSDGKRLLAGKVDGALELVDLASGVATPLAGHRSYVHGCGFVSGKRAVSGGDTTVRVWNLDTKDELFAAGHRGPVTAIAVSPDGRHVATASDDGTARLWDVADRREERVLATGREPFVSVAFAENRVFAAARDEVVLAPIDGSKVERLDPQGALLSAALDPSGTRVAVGRADGRVEVLDLRGNVIAKLRSHAQAASTVAFLDSDRVVSGGMDHCFHLQRISDRGEIWGDFLGEGAGFISLAVDRRKEAIFCGGEQGFVRILDVASGTGDVRLERSKESKRVQAVAVSPSGDRALTSSDDGKVVLWNLADHRPIDEIDLRSSSVDVGRAIAYAPDGKAFFVGTARGVVLHFKLTEQR